MKFSEDRIFPSRVSKNIYAFTTLAVLIVVGIYLAFISMLSLPDRKPSKDQFYSLLTISFRQLDLHLPISPPSELQSLPDPYSYQSRAQNNIEYPMDVSYYKGKYYLYWGPVPSLMLVFLSDDLLSKVLDRHLAILFLFGLFFYSVIFIIRYWVRYNQGLPGWLIALCISTVGAAFPTLLLLRNPRIYEAAVLGCQFFFIGGCYWAFEAMSNEGAGQRWKFLIAGLHWALALGTRIVIAPAIGALVITTVFWGWKRRRLVLLRNVIWPGFLLGLPSVAMLGGLGWYNWARFGSVFEVGVRYMLALVDYSKFTRLFSIDYVGQNILNYFIQPFRISAAFPFLRTVEDPFWNNEFAGLLITAPYVLLLGFSLFALWPSKSTRPDSSESVDASQRWLILILAEAFVIMAGIVMAYFFPSMNYAMDFVPSLLLLTTFSLTRLLSASIDAKPTLYRMLSLLLPMLAVFTLMAGVLVAAPSPR